jgi:hypothetical protein
MKLAKVEDNGLTIGDYPSNIDKARL